MVSEQIIPIFDGHNDTLTHLDGVGGGTERSFFVESAEGHIDLPRARRGGLAGGFFAIFVPDPAQAQLMKEKLVISETGYEVLPLPALDPAFAQQWTIAMVARLFRLEKESLRSIVFEGRGIVSISHSVSCYSYIRVEDCRSSCRLWGVL